MVSKGDGHLNYGDALILATERIKFVIKNFSHHSL